MILIIAGSKSDEQIVNKVKKIFDENNVQYEVQFASAHREPERVAELAKMNKYDIFIAIAGLAAALPGVVAAHTKKPVIGVPVSSKLDGLDALLSIVQMPKGVPVACVGIDNGENAAYLAMRILGVK
ncbi:MAG: N5-carboxyaminoimidazole ribonucleotide mutase [Candidatus Methanofastidiosum methylothiophilum]|uniref:N5-carboxyaminoimidazole ribonucleotide mutase n=1 Tax=Candidatus Methanofastidiosum methylothiophilum TaxID=1705564 RepID=A0A150IKK2_9EURY|nr:MAG: N5-carboxyaminoimidazole ribonucleotide mutase [Candidatus Methanofastidiosum methylthiophilus]KYC47365.1 MAG: N5-carboxyaminoimidazole ribonucleotide mutase [Candidatus Methanofastidiosum methylthiophilus]KYC49858.1 MAG: N5-carboxyaminoimidazole ribonucleotide mutase [Candidatus Methanofastidiosum methylthiophilus]